MQTMAANRVKKCIDEYSRLGKQFNVTTLAVSTLIKKLLIASIPNTDFEQDIVSFVKTELEIRYQKLFVELVDLHKRIFDPSFTFELEMGLVQLLKEIEALETEKVDESDETIFETGIAVQSEISRISRVNVILLVDLIRTTCEKKRPKVADLTNLLQTQLEEKLHVLVIE